MLEPGGDRKVGHWYWYSLYLQVEEGGRRPRVVAVVAVVVMILWESAGLSGCSLETVSQSSGSGAISFAQKIKTEEKQSADSPGCSAAALKPTEFNNSNSTRGRDGLTDWRKLLDTSSLSPSQHSFLSPLTNDPHSPICISLLWMKGTHS